MKAVILAAGLGSRLGKPLPKCLSVLPDGETILGRQVRLFRTAGIREIIVVTGFKPMMLLEKFPGVLYHYNPRFFATNTSKSLLGAVECLDGDFIWANGDVVFDAEILTELLSTQGNVMCVNTARVAEEEVKYRTDDSGKIVEISKQVQQAEGEAVGINLMRKASLEGLRVALQKCEDQDYFEKAIEILIEDGVEMRPLDISAHRCIEVDFAEDLAEARELFRE